MTNIADLKDCQCVVEAPSGKFLCFTRLARDTLILCTSDGYDLWKLDLDPSELESHREAAEIDLDSFLTKLKSCFEAQDVTVSQTGVKCILTFGRGVKSLCFELFEAKVVEKKTELQYILFSLASRNFDLTRQLSKANSTIENLKQKSDGATSKAGIFDLGDSKKSKSKPQAANKNVGMSVINPGSKKRKAAKGIDFD